MWTQCVSHCGDYVFFPVGLLPVYRVAQKECNTYDQWFQENVEQNKKKLCPLLRIKLFFQQDDTKIINFDEGVWILWPFFWGNVIFKIGHFCLKSHKLRTENIHCLAPPGKVCDLAL